MEIYGVLEKNHIGRGVSRAQYDIFFKDPHIFPYYPSKCLHNEFILPMILPVYQLRKERHKHDFKTYPEFILFTLSFGAI